jgi:hypothetical protein
MKGIDDTTPGSSCVQSRNVMGAKASKKLRP